MLAHHRKAVIIVLVFGDAVLISIGFILAHWMRAHLQIFEYRSLQPLAQCLPLLPLMVFSWIVGYAVAGLYNIDRPRTLRELLSVTVVASGMGLVLFLALAFMLREFRASRLMLIHCWVIFAVGAVFLRSALQAVLLHGTKNGKGLANVLVVGPPDTVEPLCGWMQARPGWGLRAVPFFTKNGSTQTELFEGAIARHQPSEVVFMGRPPEQVLSTCRRRGLNLRFLPDLPPVSLLRVHLDNFAGLPTLCLRELPAATGQCILKRALDIVLSSAFLVMVAPLFAVVAVLIKLDNRGPIFFKQTRIGKDGQPFQMLKFRSMKVDAAKGPPVKVTGRSDPRVTRVGGWLRRLSLDELPQLINVLKGEMSLVGPRPETPLYVDQYSDWNRLRLLVKPGIAGLAQANGVRGNTTIDEKTHYDIAYIENQSPAVDLALLVKTVVSLPLHREAY